MCQTCLDFQAPDWITSISSTTLELLVYVLVRTEDRSTFREVYYRETRYTINIQEQEIRDPDTAAYAR